MRDYYSETASSADIEELHEVCRSAVEYLHEKGCPHDKILIGWDSAELLKGEFGTRYEVPD